MWLLQNSPWWDVSLLQGVQALRLLYNISNFVEMYMFKYFYSGILLTSVALAARPFLNEPDTGITDVLGDLPKGQLPNLTDIVALNDFEWTARNYLPLFNYTYYRNGAGGEWSYRNNLEVYNRYRLRPRTMLDISNIEASLR